MRLDTILSVRRSSVCLSLENCVWVELSPEYTWFWSVVMIEKYSVCTMPAHADTIVSVGSEQMTQTVLIGAKPSVSGWATQW